MVGDGNGLENRRAVKSLVGSIPSLSANYNMGRSGNWLSQVAVTHPLLAFLVRIQGGPPIHCSYRLTVRSLDFQSGNEGSIPSTSTNFGHRITSSNSKTNFPFTKKGLVRIQASSIDQLDVV